MRRPRLLMVARPCLLLAASAAITGTGAFQPPTARPSAIHVHFGHPCRKIARANGAWGWDLEGRIRGGSEGGLDAIGGDGGCSGGGGGDAGGLSCVDCDSGDGAAVGLTHRPREPAKALRASMAALGGASCLGVAGTACPLSVDPLAWPSMESNYATNVFNAHSQTGHTYTYTHTATNAVAPRLLRATCCDQCRLRVWRC